MYAEAIPNIEIASAIRLPRNDCFAVFRESLPKPVLERAEVDNSSLYNTKIGFVSGRIPETQKNVMAGLQYALVIVLVHLTLLLNNECDTNSLS